MAKSKVDAWVPFVFPGAWASVHKPDDVTKTGQFASLTLSQCGRAPKAAHR